MSTKEGTYWAVEISGESVRGLVSGYIFITPVKSVARAFCRQYPPDLKPRVVEVIVTPKEA